MILEIGSCYKCRGGHIAKVESQTIDKNFFLVRHYFGNDMEIISRHFCNGKFANLTERCGYDIINKTGCDENKDFELIRQIDCDKAQDTNNRDLDLT